MGYKHIKPKDNQPEWWIALSQLKLENAQALPSFKQLTIMFV